MCKSCHANKGGLKQFKKKFRHLGGNITKTWNTSVFKPILRVYKFGILLYREKGDTYVE